MSRVKRGVTKHARHQKILKAAKGYYGARRKLFGVALQAVEKASAYAYRDRKNRKRVFRSLWITRINAGAREHGLSYSELISKLKSNNISINRKVLADLAMNDPKKFEQIIKSLK